MTLLQGAGAAIVARQSNGEIQLVSRLATELLEATASSLVGQPVSSVLSRLGLQQWDGEEPAIAELHLSNGSLICVEVEALPCGDGEDAYIVLSIERKANVGNESQHDLHELVEQLRHSNEALEVSNMELRQFAYIASHDLQTPLRAIGGFAEFLQQDYAGKLGASADEYIRQIHNGVQTMRSLIDNLLKYSRVDSRASSFQSTDLNIVVGQVLDSMDADECGMHVQREPLPTVMADASQMAQLFENLLSNAFKFKNGERGSVHISSQEDESGWRVIVQDDGIGIAPRYHDRVFEIFRRLHRADQYPGDGVGLAVARRIVHRHRGRIWVESSEGCGSKFVFTLPIDDRVLD